MIWNWQRKNWPHFEYQVDEIKSMEDEFLQLSGKLMGVSSGLRQNDFADSQIEIMTEESLMTSKIEGEILRRESVKYSLRKNFNLESDSKYFSPAEKGIADAMKDLHLNYNTPLSHDMLFKWHGMLMNGRNDLSQIGAYRIHEDPMQVVSGPLHRPMIHFQAPPSEKVVEEMDQFIYWWNKTINSSKLGILARTSISHLYFESIHPFEDGNGRIGRMLALKSIFERIGSAQFILLSQIIEQNKKQYYEQLEVNNKDLEINSWAKYFANELINASKASVELIHFISKKTRFYDHYKSLLNERQTKVIGRIFQEGPNGFKGGLSAENYISITHTSRATATRDLQELVDRKIMYKTGMLKSTRYFLNLNEVFPEPIPLA